MPLPIVSSYAQQPRPTRPLPTVAALEALWQEFAAEPMWLPMRVWRRLTLGRRLRLRQLEPSGVQVVAPPGKINDCTSCTDLCCIGPRNAVLLRLRDVATLHDVGQAHLMVQQKPTFSPQELAARPALRRQVHSAAWRRFPVLAQNAFGACMALRDDGKCGLYPYWPSSCARFPYSLDVDAAEVFYARRCQSYFVHPRNQQAVRHLAAQAVAGYNDRIKDALLLRFRAESLANLGLLRYLMP